MTHLQGNPGEIHGLARYEVRPDALDEVVAASSEGTTAVRSTATGGLAGHWSRRANHARVAAQRRSVANRQEHIGNHEHLG